MVEYYDMIYGSAKKEEGSIRMDILCDLILVVLNVDGILAELVLTLCVI